VAFSRHPDGRHHRAPYNQPIDTERGEPDPETGVRILPVEASLLSILMVRIHGKQAAFCIPEDAMSLGRRKTSGSLASQSPPPGRYKIPGGLFHSARPEEPGPDADQQIDSRKPYGVTDLSVMDEPRGQTPAPSICDAIYWRIRTVAADLGRNLDRGGSLKIWEPTCDGEIATWPPCWATDVAFKASWHVMKIGSPRRRPIFWLRRGPVPSDQTYCPPPLAIRAGGWKLFANPDGSKTLAAGCIPGSQPTESSTSGKPPILGGEDPGGQSIPGPPGPIAVAGG
jgi:hypothetical protein